MWEKIIKILLAVQINKRTRLRVRRNIIFHGKKKKKQEEKKEEEKIKLPRIHASNPEYRVNSNNKIIIEKKWNNLFSKLTLVNLR